MKLAPFLLALSAADLKREITNQCSANVGEQANVLFGSETNVEKVTLTIPAEKKNDYFGLEVLMHHSSYKRPARCGTKGREVNFGSLLITILF